MAENDAMQVTTVTVDCPHCDALLQLQLKASAGIVAVLKAGYEVVRDKEDEDA